MAEYIIEICPSARLLGEIAEDFRETFGDVQRGDLGKRVYRTAGVLQMENNEQRDARQAKEA